LSWIVGGAVVIYLVLGFALDILVAKMPARIEQTVGSFFSRAYNFKKSPSAGELKLQALLDELTRQMPESNFEYTVHIAQSPQVNALALPGGNILVFSGLLKEVKSENELSMVLAHELGHFAHRDQLRGLGRGAVFIVLSGAVFGVDSQITEFAQKALLTTELEFSRQQEAAADKFALGLLYKRYGHVGGAVDFFEHLKDKTKTRRFLNFFSTHPYPLERINLLEKEIRKRGYPLKDKIPFNFTEPAKKGFKN
jgi:predicted Zn-dependent protease